MKKNQGFSAISLIFSIVIIVVIVGTIGYVGFNFINQYTEEDVEYNKIEVLDTLNNIVKGKYVVDSKQAADNKQNIDEIYNDDVVIQYLLANKYVEILKDVNDNVVENQYYINPDGLNSDIATGTLNENGAKGNGTKLFKIKRQENKFSIYFVDKYGEENFIGDLVTKPEV